jgi:hypothetical protein
VARDHPTSLAKIGHNTSHSFKSFCPTLLPSICVGMKHHTKTQQRTQGTRHANAKLRYTLSIHIIGNSFRNFRQSYYLKYMGGKSLVEFMEPIRIRWSTLPIWPMTTQFASFAFTQVGKQHHRGNVIPWTLKNHQGFQRSYWPSCSGFTR